jgi:hypothetical protein
MLIAELKSLFVIFSRNEWGSGKRKRRSMGEKREAVPKYLLGEAETGGGAAPRQDNIRTNVLICQGVL